MLVSADVKGCAMFSSREKVVAKDTVGAGDAFLGSLGSYLARGLTLEAAVGKAVRWVWGKGTRAVEDIGGECWTRNCRCLPECPKSLVFSTSFLTRSPGAA